MSNGFFTDVPENPFDPFGDFGRRRDRDRQRRRERERLRERIRQEQEIRRRAETRRRALQQSRAQVRAARTSRGEVFARIARAARLAGIGGTIVGIAADIAAEVRRLQEERIDENLRAANEQLERKLQRRAKEKVLRTTGVRRAVERPGSPAQLGDRSAIERVRVQSAPPGGAVRVQPGRPESPDVPRPGPIQPGAPVFTPPPAPGRPGSAPEGFPGRQRTVNPEIFPDIPGFPQGAPGAPNIPSPTVDPTTIPGFGVPAPLQFPTPAPGVFSPPGFAFPPGTPRLPSPTTPPRLAAPLTDFETGLLELPQPLPQPQQQPQRCRPCPGEEPPQPRTKCEKGLYVEGRLDNQVRFIPWAEVDCETGRETGGPGGISDPGFGNVISILEAIG